MKDSAYYQQLVSKASSLLLSKPSVVIDSSNNMQNKDLYNVLITRVPTQFFQNNIVVRKGYVSAFGMKVLICFYEDKICYLGFVNKSGKYNVEQDVLETFPKAEFSSLTTTDVNYLTHIFSVQSGSDNEKTDVQLVIAGSDFQIEVLTELCQLHFAEFISYSDLSNRLNKPRAVRAIASAVGRNKISYFIPCHRVLRTDGTLGGYRWGLDAKLVLLMDEHPDCIK